MNPFRNILRLSVGDFLAKALNFLAFVYLARILGVANYGVLEFAHATQIYFLFLADGGLELWATREAARGKDVRQLAASILPLRLLLATGAFGALLLLLPAFPDHPALQVLLVLFGLTLFIQAVTLKWVFMGQEQMTCVAAGLAVAQIVFAGSVFIFVHSPARVVWVPVLRLVGDLAMAAYFMRAFAARYGSLRLAFTLRSAGSMLRSALPMGASHALALMSYNFDSVLLGFFLGPTAVGWYSAAYKPVTVVLAMPVTYFLGLFPALSRAHAESRAVFRDLVVSSLRMTAIFAVPIGVGGTFLADPLIDLLFGPAYKNSIPVLQLLSWSAVLVILRGTYRQALNASGRPGLDLRCASAATTLNVCLNLVLIPRYGMVGAAVATLVAEVLWFTIASWHFYRYVTPVSPLPHLIQPAVATIAMGTCFLLVHGFFWGVQACASLLVYVVVLWLLRQAAAWQPRYQ